MSDLSVQSARVSGFPVCPDDHDENYNAIQIILLMNDESVKKTSKLYKYIYNNSKFRFYVKFCRRLFLCCCVIDISDQNQY